MQRIRTEMQLPGTLPATPIRCPGRLRWQAAAMAALLPALAATAATRTREGG